MNTFSPTRLAQAAGLSIALAATQARAQPAAPDDAASASQSVQVAGLRHPSVMRYVKAWDLVMKTDPDGLHRLKAVFRVTAKGTHAPPADLRVRIEGEHTYLPVPVSATGIVDLPMDKAAYDDQADIVANEPEGSLDLGFFLLPVLPAQGLRQGDIATAVDAVNATVRGIVPWYARLLMSSTHGVGFCYAQPGQVVSIDGATTATRAATEPAKTLTDEPVFCAKFSAAEANAARDVTLTPAPGWQALFW